MTFDLISAPCPVFGRCGGCSYQNLSHETELQLKTEVIRDQFQNSLGLSDEVAATVFEPIVSSPQEYNYRHRLDLAVRRLKTGELLFGFVGSDRKTLLVDQCPIAMKAISDFLPELRRQALEKLPPKYKVANITVKTGDDGRVLWGGIGKGSLRVPEDQYLWAEVNGKRIHYSLDTFFQANLSILPKLYDTFLKWAPWKRENVLLDIYGGVGLFSVLFADHVSKVISIEQSSNSTKLAEFNKQFHHLEKMQIRTESAETSLKVILDENSLSGCHAIIDPPRNGLAAPMLEALCRTQNLQSLFYLSCSPETLLRDLKILTQDQWQISKIIPCDFFPKTGHLEVLTLLMPKSKIHF